MSVGFLFSHFSSCYFSLLLVMVPTLFPLCTCNTNFHDVLCKDDERQALVEFKHGLIDESNRLASWVGTKNDCCNWAGIVCDNSTGHVQKIHLPNNCHTDDYSTTKEYEECSNQRLIGNLSPSLLHLKQLKHLDLSNNDFGGIKIPSFMGSLKNLRYLNLSRSRFGGTIPPQLGNLSELHTLSLGSFYNVFMERELTSMRNMHWLSSLHRLHHLDMSGVDISKVTDWLQVINTLPSLVELHLSDSKLSNIYPHVPSLNLTSLAHLDLSDNYFINSSLPRWIFSISTLVSLDLSWCGFHDYIPNGIDLFSNLTSLESLHVPGNNFMDSSLVVKGLSCVGRNLISLDISFCGISSSVLDALYNLTSLLSLDLSRNELTKTISKSFANLCNLRRVNLEENYFSNISLTSVLESFFECKLPRLESLSLGYSRLSGQLPYEIGRLTYLVDLQLENNGIVGMIPDSIGRLLSLETLDLSYNQLNGSLPDSVAQLSKLVVLDISNNLLTGVLTKSHFVKLARLKILSGRGNILTLRSRLANWIPSFRLLILALKSWDLGPRFPSWLQVHMDLIYLDISNARISSTMPDSFWRSFPNLSYLDMSQNHIQGILPGILAPLKVLDVSSNEFGGPLPQLSNSSLPLILDLSNNSFSGSLRHLLCANGEKGLAVLNLANNHLSGVIPDCWQKWPRLSFLNMEKNNLSGTIPTTLGYLSSLGSLNMCNNKLSGKLHVSMKNLTNLQILQLAGNELAGRIPAWFGRELPKLRILNLRSNNFHGDITRQLCNLTAIQILDLADNNLSGNIPRCIINFGFLTGKETNSKDEFNFSPYEDMDALGSASLVIKGREDTYSTILGLVMALDLSCNNFSGQIPNEIMALKALRSLNLSRNQLTGRIPEKIGDLKLLESFDVSLNLLSGELPLSLSTLSFLSNFNVSYNSLTGRIPSSTQLQGFNESSFLGNKLCGDPLTISCVVEVPKKDQNDDNNIGSHGTDWGLIISIVSGFIVGFWALLTPLMVSTTWRIAYFSFLRIPEFGFELYQMGLRLKMCFDWRFRDVKVDNGRDRWSDWVAEVHSRRQVVFCNRSDRPDPSAALLRSERGRSHRPDPPVNTYIYPIEA
ncbi:hypothetical protein L1887_08828 [Cichorium endivia]|nr:hypothetical protein L1887_08828 [Cichorium endivia]